ncbi:hypothetical protein JM66_12655 [Aeromonas bestiarum]|nr:hypothetical protein JM66_12655 [Aeromonas bestiarum]
MAALVIGRRWIRGIHSISSRNGILSVLAFIRWLSLSTGVGSGEPSHLEQARELVVAGVHGVIMDSDLL